MLRTALLLVLAGQLFGTAQAPLGELAPGATQPKKSQIQWRSDYAGTLAQAKADGKPVLIALNMDGERANDRLAEESYHDRDVVDLSKQVLCLVGSIFYHGEGECERFGEVTCEQHQTVDKGARAGKVARDEAGDVIAPQHILLDSEGEVILSVPYSITAEELAWCLARAIAIQDPDTKTRAPAGARPPKRLVMDAPVEPAGDPAAVASPATLEEALELIATLRKGGGAAGRYQALARILTCDEEQAVEFILQELRGKTGKRPERRKELVHQIGVLSPPRFWEAVVPFAKDGEESMREEAAAALEQLAAPESVKDLGKILKKEKVGYLRGAWLRALASAGAADSKTRSTIIKAAGREKDLRARAGAIVALGYLAPHKDVTSAIEDALREEEREHVLAAACAMALTRDKAWRESLWPLLKNEPKGWFEAGLVSCLEVLTQGRLERVAPTLKRVCGDRISRERFFGKG